MKPIRFELDGVFVEASHGESVLDACLRRKIALEHSCGGFGTCGTCRVFVIEGAELLEPLNEVEAEMKTDREFESNERLACQTHPVPGLRLRRPPKP